MRIAILVCLMCGLVGNAYAQSARSVSCSVSAESINGAPGTIARVQCPAGCGSSTAWGTDVYSDDSSICTAAIHAGAISRSGGTVEVTITPGQPSYSSSTRSGISTSSWGQWDRSFRVRGAGVEVPSGGAIQLACATTAESLSGESGTSHTVVCPANCTSQRVWGTDVYSDDSAICAAAIHAGALSARGGTTRVRILPGQSAYAPSTRNGISTSSWGQWDRSFLFGEPQTQEAAPTGRQVSCSETAEAIGGESGTTVAVICPANCGRATAWGTDIYSDDSALCTAAIHAGVVGRSGGAVIVTIRPGERGYVPSLRHGVQTSSWGQWDRSFTVARPR